MIIRDRSFRADTMIQSIKIVLAFILAFDASFVFHVVECKSSLQREVSIRKYGHVFYHKTHLN